LGGKETLKMATMTETLTREISKADVERFLYGKHITACPACGRFRSQCDLEVHSISCQRAQATSLQTASTPVDVLMVVCQNCGAIQFHDRTVVAKWLDCQRRVK
jgi:NMD protein affecting ribosome stability and mRNA decay